VTGIQSAQIVANMVIMARAADKKKSALLIEGDKDTRVYRKVTDLTLCTLYAAGNRAHAEGALAILKASKQPGVLAVVDADSDHLNAKVSVDPDLIVTHTRDVECMLLTAPVLRALLIEFDLPENSFGPHPEKAFVNAAAALGYIRFVIEQKGWKVRTTEIDFAQFVNSNTLRCDPKALCSHIAKLTMTTGIAASSYESELQKLAGIGHDPFKVARGHDVSSLLAWAITIKGGKKRKGGADIKGFLVEGYLRTAYPEAAFAATELFKKIEFWETQNEPFKVLRR
jgi:Protein of unknown function (DUF4435)